MILNHNILYLLLFVVRKTASCHICIHFGLKSDLDNQDGMQREHVLDDVTFKTCGRRNSLRYEY